MSDCRRPRGIAAAAPRVHDTGPWEHPTRRPCRFAGPSDLVSHSCVGHDASPDLAAAHAHRLGCAASPGRRRPPDLASHSCVDRDKSPDLASCASAVTPRRTVGPRDPPRVDAGPRDSQATRGNSSVSPSHNSCDFGLGAGSHHAF